MKKTPLKRKRSMRDAYADKMRKEGFDKRPRNGFHAPAAPKPRKPLRKVSKAQRARLARYNEMRHDFLNDPANEFCEICIRRRESGEAIGVNYSSEIHHKFMRTGRNLFTGFIASCFPCRLWPHENPKKAREMGLLG